MKPIHSLHAVAIAIVALIFILPMYAKPQRKTTTKIPPADSLVLLQREIIDAEQKGLPKTVSKQAKRLSQLAERQRNFPHLLYATMKQSEAQERINSENRTGIFSELERISLLPWLSSTERTSLALSTAEIYLDHRNGYRYYPRLSNTIGTADPIIPKAWTTPQYEARLTILLERAYTHLETLSEPDPMIYREGKASKGRTLLEQVSSIALGLRDDLPASKALTISALERYEKLQISEPNKLRAQYTLAKLRGASATELDTLLESYRHLPEVLNYIDYSLIYHWGHTLGTRGAVERIDHFCAGHRDIPREVSDQRTYLLAPRLDLGLMSRQILGRRSLELSIRHQHLESVRVDIYPRPLRGLLDDKHYYFEETPQGKPLLSRDYTLADSDTWAEQTLTDSIEMPATGNYLVVVSGKRLQRATPSGELVERSAVSVSDIFPIMRTISRVERKIFWLNAVSGSALPNLPLEIALGNKLSERKTDQAGAVSFSNARERITMRVKDSRDPLRIEQYLYDYPQELLASNASESLLFITSERGAYRPGQTVYLYGYLWKIGKRAEDAQAISERTLRLEVNDPNDDTIYTEEIETDRFGRVQAKFDIPALGRLGRYEISLDGSGLWEASTEIEVYEYKRPQFEVKLTRPDRMLMLGDSIEIEALVEELNGAPMSHTPIVYSVRVQEYTPWWRSYGNTQSKTSEYTITTDATGRAILPLHLTRLSDTSEDAGPMVYEIEARATSSTGETQRDQMRLIVGDSFHSLDCSMPRFIDREGSATLRFEAKDRDGAPIRQPVQISILREGKLLRQDSLQSETDIDLSPYTSRLSSGWYTLQYRLPLLSGKHYEGSKSFYIYGTRDRQIDLQGNPLMLCASKQTYRENIPPSIYYASGQPDSYVYCTVILDDRAVMTDVVLRPKANILTALDLSPYLKGGAYPETIIVNMQTVRYGRSYEETLSLTRQQPDKSLELRWETWRDRIRVGSEEEWHMQVFYQGKPITAGVSSWMYDAAIDLVQPFDVGAPQVRISPDRFLRELQASSLAFDPKTPTLYKYTDQDPKLKDIPEEMMVSEDAPLMEAVAVSGMGAPRMAMATQKVAFATADEAPSPSAPIVVRTELGELSYFYPMMTTGADGRVAWSFRLPESLTRWRVEVMAHTLGMDYGHRTDYVESFRELQVRPYLPRQLRRGDSSTLTTSVRNTSDRTLTGVLHLELFDTRTDSLVHTAERPFSLMADSVQGFTFAVSAPVGMDSVGVRLRGVTEHFSDGEQHILPIVPDTEETVRALAFILTKAEPQTFDLSGLFPSGGFLPEAGQLDIRLESNPMYLALLSLPTQLEVQSDDAISLATALYAQRLTRYLSAQPGLRAWLDARSETIAPERNPILLTPTEQTPYHLRLEAQREYDRLIALRTALDNATEERETALIDRLTQLRGSDTLTPWFPGMKGSPYVTLSVMRIVLRSHTFVSDSTRKVDQSKLLSMLWTGVDQELAQEVKRIQEYEAKSKKRDYAEIPYQALDYLYLHTLSDGRSLNGNKVADFVRPRLKAIVHTLPLEEKALASAVFAPSDRALADTLLMSLREHLSYDDEGASFANIGTRYWWSSRVYSTMTHTIEALVKLSPDQLDTITAMQRWLLAQKRGVQWESRLATAEVLYALTLAQGKRELETARQTSAELTFTSGKSISWSSERRGVSTAFDRASAPTTLTLTPSSEGQVWASASARYELPIREQTASGKQLRIVRRYYLRRIANGQETLTEILTNADEQMPKLRIGDRLITRLFITLERDLDFVQLRDPRLGCAEPLSSKVGYTWGGGTAYYLEPRDGATNFYFDYLSRGSYIFEYEQSVVRSGVYQAPSAYIQSIYAPEYTATSGYGGSISVEP